MSQTEDVYTQIETRELARLRAIENAGLRVVSSQGSRVSDLVITVGVKALRRLEAALEARS